MLFYNANIFQAETGFITGSFETESGCFTKVCFGQENAKDTPESGTDLKGAAVIPGLIDIHTHGNSGVDFSDGNKEGLSAMAGYLLKNGITGFLPTSMTLPEKDLKKAFEAARDLVSEKYGDCAEILGIHMEGPFLSKEHKGAQNPDYLIPPDADMFFRLQDASGNLIKIVDVAPETEGAFELIREISKKGKCRISLAHTDADYDTAAEAFDMGAAHVTHLFNGMRPMHHRNPGVIGAACDRDDVTVELICDGIHVHPSVVRTAFKLFSHRICLISDSLRCCGLPDGEYELAGQTVILKGREARLKDGTLAGSVANLFDCMKNAIDFGVPVALAIEAATLTPAKALGIEDHAGAIKNGNNADFIICDDKMNIKEVYKNGIRRFTDEDTDRV